MRYELKSVPIWPLAKVAFFVHLVVGFLIGVLYAVVMLPFMAVLANIPELQAEGLDVAAAPLGILMVTMPFFLAMSGAFFGTLFSVILALVYNLMARFVGGLELDFTAKDSAAASTVEAPTVVAQASPVSPTPPPPAPVDDRSSTPPAPPPVGPTAAPEKTEAEPKENSSDPESSEDKQDLL